jgi:D-methionine transport system ATP-binding protein
MIELRHLGKTYDPGTDHAVVALQDISLTVADGEIFGIIGLSGAGKSTLVRCINLLEKPTAGEVLLDGRDLTKLPPRELLLARRSIGMIFQDFNLLEQRTVLKNVLYPLELAHTPKAEAVSRARELLKLVSLSDKEKSYPSQLSGGQKQRVAIARALATKPRYLLCDEATSALDPNTTQAILELLQQINKTLGVTIVVITHEMKVIDRICNKVAVIDQSRIAESGKVSEVFVNPQSEIARELILQKERQPGEIRKGRRIRIVFDGTTSYRPVISELVLACQAPVNIMLADTRDVGGVAYGHMIVELPADARQQEKITAWLKTSGIMYNEEV